MITVIVLKLILLCIRQKLGVMVKHIFKKCVRKDMNVRWIIHMNKDKYMNKDICTYWIIFVC